MQVRFAAICAALLGSSGCATSQSVAAATDCPPSRNWSAWVNAMPGPGAVPTLIVTGEVLLPNGTAATLSPGPTDRMTPPGQHFALIVARGKRPGGWRSVRGEIRPALASYREVLVGCDGATLARISPVERAM